MKRKKNSESENVTGQNFYFHRYKYKIFKHQHTRQAAQDETYNMSVMSNYSATQPASFTTFTR